MLLLEQNTTKKGQEFSVPEFKPGNDEEYKVEAIRDSAVYAKESRQIPSRAILFGCMKGLPERREYLGTFLGCHAPPEGG